MAEKMGSPYLLIRSKHKAQNQARRQRRKPVLGIHCKKEEIKADESKAQHRVS